MIDPPQVFSEEPTAVTPHGGIRGGESQQWLSYPTNPVLRFLGSHTFSHGLDPLRSIRNTGPGRPGVSTFAH